MTFIREKRQQAFASRLKALSELLMQDVKRFYDHKQIEFEPRWYGLFMLLKERGSLSVTEIAKELLQSHPAVNQTVSILEKKGLVESRRDGNDDRRRLIFLTAEGKERVKALVPLWEDIHKANAEMLEESAPLFLEQLGNLEEAVSLKSFYDRIIETDRKRNSGLTLKSFSKELGSHFSSLNKQWLEHYFELEPPDLEMLRDPLKIIKKKGEIYFAEYNGIIAGTFCLIPAAKGSLEFAKLAVDPLYRRKGIGRFLLDSGIERAARLKARELILYTSPVLIEANNLYIKRGFYYVENDQKERYKRPTVKMRLDIEG